MIYEVRSEHATRKVDVRKEADGVWLVSVDGGPTRRITGGRWGSSEWHLQSEQSRRVLGLFVDGSRADVVVDGNPVRLEVVDPRRSALSLGAGGGEGAVVTQMPGAVVRVLVTEGEAVKAGTPLLVLEAMKMENELKSPIDGVVESLPVAAGDRVDAGTLLASVRPE